MELTNLALKKKMSSNRKIKFDEDQDEVEKLFPTRKFSNRVMFVKKINEYEVNTDSSESEDDLELEDQ